MKFYSKLFSSLLTLFGLLILVYTFYKSNFILQGLENDYLTKYFYIGFIFFIIGIFSFFLRIEQNINFSLMIISTVFCLYSVEFILTIIKDKRSTAAGEKFIPEKILREKPDFDTRNRLQVYLDEKKKYNDQVAVLPVPSVLAHDNYKKILLLSGHSKIRTVFCNELGYYIIYDSDRYGFRNPDNEWDKNEIDYLIVGDSLAHGMCVEEKDTISGWLRDNNLNNGGVLNLALWANGPLLMYATLREYLPLKKVKNVLWIHSEGNDFTDLNFEIKSSILNNYLRDKKFSQNLPSRQKEIDLTVRNFIANNEIKGQGNSFYDQNLKIKFLKFLKLTKIRTLTIDKPTNKKQPLLENLDLFKKIIIDAKKLSEKNGAKFYYVDLPDLFARKHSSQKNLLYDEKKIATKEIKDFLIQNNIPYIDIYEKVFKDHPDQMSLFPFRGYGHFNQKGYTLSARSIMESIEKIESNNK